MSAPLVPESPATVSDSLHDHADPTEATPSEESTTEELRIQLLQLIAKTRSALQRLQSAYSRLPGGVAVDLFRGQSRALALLAEHGELAQRDMCRMLGIRPQSLGETLAKLERSGYVTREPIDRDHRALKVTITDAGRETIARAKPSALLTSFSAEELRQFASYLSRALEDIERQSAKLELDAD